MNKKDFIYTSLKVLIGAALLGLVISLFQFLIHLISESSLELFQNSSLGLFIGVVIISFVYFIGLVALNRKIGGYTGSGIPQVEAYHAGWYSYNPLLMIGFLFLNSLSAFYGGFLLGAEGPSVTIGASLAMLLNKVDKKEDKELVAAMASAGFGVALMAPVAGFFHMIEENRKILSWSLIVKGLVIVAISFTIGYFVYNHTLFNIHITGSLSGLYYLYIPLFMIFAIVMGKVFQIALVGMKKLFTRYSYLDYLTPAIAVMFIVLRRFFPNFSASGSALIALDLVDLSLAMLVFITLWRMFAGGLSLASKVSGGLTIPTLAYGYLVGGLLVSIIALVDPAILEYKGIFMVLTMVVVFGVVCDTPLAGLFIGLSMGTLEALALPLTITAFAYILLDECVLKWNSIYKDLERLLPGYKEVSHGAI